MLEQLARVPFANLLVAELAVSEQAEDYGMHGSGMVIVNAPWQLDEQLSALLPFAFRIAWRRTGRDSAGRNG